MCIHKHIYIYIYIHICFSYIGPRALPAAPAGRRGAGRSPRAGHVLPTYLLSCQSCYIPIYLFAYLLYTYVYIYTYLFAKAVSYYIPIYLLIHIYIQ